MPGWTEEGAAAAFVDAEARLRGADLGWRGVGHDAERLFNSLRELPRLPQTRFPRLLAKLFPALEDLKPRCSLPECDEWPIANSHTLSQGAHLSRLGGDRLRYPDLRVPGYPTIGTISRRRASVFPGYCGSHESELFEGFENAGRFRDARDKLRQLMRSAAREEWKAERDGYAIDELICVVDAALDKWPVEQSVLKYWRPELVEPLENWRSHVQLRRTYAMAIHHDLAGARDALVMPPWVWAHTYRSKLRVALSGSSHVIGRRPFTVVMAFVPDGGSSTLIVGSSSDDADNLARYMRVVGTSPAQLDRLVLAWMSYATNHWFASASWWDGVSESIKSDVLNHLASPTRPQSDPWQRAWIL